MDHYESLNEHLREIETALEEDISPFAHGLVSVLVIMKVLGNEIYIILPGTGESNRKKVQKKLLSPLPENFLSSICTMLKQGTLFDEFCFEDRRKNCEQK